MKPLVQMAGAALRVVQRHVNRDFRGQYRLVKLLSRVLPAYQGEVVLNDGLKMCVNTARSGVEEWLFFTGTHQHTLTEFLRDETKKGYYCIDVGGHLGFYTLKFANWVGSEGLVAAFEPNPAIYDELLENAKRNKLKNIEVVNKAVSDKIGNASFFITTPGMSSLHPSRSGCGNSIQVLVTTIDEFIQSSGWPRFDLIKIDAEGYDCHVILGAQKSIMEFTPLIALEYSLICDKLVCRAALEILNSLDYVYVNLLTGERALHMSPNQFELWLSHGRKHIDVICYPPSKV